jgi:hypothetical protein
MNTKFTSLTLAALLLSGFCAVQGAESLDSAKRAEVQAALSGLSLAEAIQSSASFVAVASDADRKLVATAVLRVMARSHADALPQVTGAISARTPELAGFVAAEAVQMHPDQAADIIQFAVKAGSEQAAAIVESVLYQNPSLYQVVGLAAMNAAPEKSRDILRAVSLSTLEVKASIDQALAANATISATEGKTILLRGINTSKASTRYQPMDIAGGQVTKTTLDYGAVNRSLAMTGKGYGWHRSLDMTGGQLAMNTPDYGVVNPYGVVNVSAGASKQASTVNAGFSPVVDLGYDSASRQASAVNAGSSPAFMPPPTFSLPPVPLPANFIETGVGQTHSEPPGGRSYSTP